MRRLGPASLLSFTDTDLSPCAPWPMHGLTIPLSGAGQGGTPDVFGSPIRPVLGLPSACCVWLMFYPRLTTAILAKAGGAAGQGRSGIGGQGANGLVGLDQDVTNCCKGGPLGANPIAPVFLRSRSCVRGCPFLDRSVREARPALLSGPVCRILTVL